MNRIVDTSIRVMLPLIDVVLILRAYHPSRLSSAEGSGPFYWKPEHAPFRELAVGGGQTTVCVVILNTLSHLMIEHTSPPVSLNTLSHLMSEHTSPPTYAVFLCHLRRMAPP
jgi:hypothetical protein